MAYNVVDIAKYIVTYCNQKSSPISNLKLQKILYYVWVDYYKETGKELFLDNICAWQLGPVVPEAYYEFCSFAGTAINRSFEVDIESNDIYILNQIVDKYIDVPAHILVDRTHQQGSPWHIIYKDGYGCRDIIPFSLIKSKECGC